MPFSALARWVVQNGLVTHFARSHGDGKEGNAGVWVTARFATVAHNG